MSTTEPTYEIQNQFDAAWWASLPTAVQAIQKITSADAKLTLFDTLIAHGFGRFLMVSIMLENFDPYTTLGELSSLGYTWINNATQIEVGYPGQFSSPGIPPGAGSLGPYPTTPPPNTIVIPPIAALLEPNANVAALLATWYPPYTPAPPVPPVPTDPVGAQVAPGSAYYLNAAGVNENNYPNGSEFTDSRGTFVHLVYQTPFGNESQWMLL